MKNTRLITALVALALLSLAAPTSATEGVSPGATDRMALVNNACPTFSWGMTESAAAYDLVAYALPDEVSQQVELKADREVLFTRVAGSATSWTPSSEQCFAPGGRYVWFVRSVTELVGEEVIEASEWSAGRYFSVPAAPSPEEMRRALEVIRRWEASAVAGASTVSSGTGTGTGTGHRKDTGGTTKSVQTASTAIRGENPETSLEAYGVVGTSASVDGAGVAAANTDGGPDLVLDGSYDGVPGVELSEWGLNRPGAADQTFALQNTGSGRLHLNVVGDIFGHTIDVEEMKINGSTVIDDTGEWMGTGSTVPCAGCVGSLDITDGGVATADLAVNAVDSTKILNASIQRYDLADDIITSPKIADGSISGSDLGADSVETVHIATGGVTSPDIRDGTITAPDISDGAVTSLGILNGTVATNDIADGAVATDKIGDFSITGTKIGPSAVDGVHIADGAVHAADVATASILSHHIVDGTITAADAAPHGGLYVDKASLYTVQDAELVDPGLVVHLVARCRDANDLPLQGWCETPIGGHMEVW